MLYQTTRTRKLRSRAGREVDFLHDRESRFFVDQYAHLTFNLNAEQSAVPPGTPVVYCIIGSGIKVEKRRIAGALSLHHLRQKYSMWMVVFLT